MIEESNKSSYTSIQPHEIVKYQNVMEMLDSEPAIRIIYLDLSGFQEFNVAGKKIVKRVRQPSYTDEFVQEIILELHSTSNVITAQTDVETWKIDQYLRHLFNALIEYYYIVGRDHFVSEDSWSKILEIHRKAHVVQDGKDQVLVSGWYPILYQNWNPDLYISRLMLKHVKAPLEISDYSTRVEKLWRLQFNLVRAALYRSREALTLIHHQKVEKIKETIQEDMKRKTLIDKITSAGSRIGGSQ